MNFSSVEIPQNRVIMHIDMNAFFASVEQSANPFIRNLPIAVGNPKYDNTALVAVSYEARARGVKNLSRGLEARANCPELIIVPFDPIKYYAINRQIVSIFREYTPHVEVYSIDEAFIDLTHLPPKLKGRTARDIAQEIKDRIVAEVGVKLRSSVGIAPNKLLAKVGSNWQKPDGLTEITWENRFEYLDKLEIGDIWGVGFRGAPKLRQLGINNTADLRQIDANTLHNVIGTYYTRLMLIANGENYDPVSPHRSSRAHKSMQHAHTMSKATADTDYLKTVIRKQAERLAKRLRKHGQRAEMVNLGFKPARQAEGYGWGSPTTFHGVVHVPYTNHGQDLYEGALQIMDRFELKDTLIRLVYVGVGNLHHTEQALLDVFDDKKKTALDRAADKINDTYGGFTLRSADIVYQYAKERELSVDKEDMVFHPE